MQGREDTTWSQRRDDWQRLLWVRTAVAKTTQEKFAKSLEMGRSAYLRYEAPGDRHLKVDYDLAVRVQNAHSINWDWLLNGNDTPWTGIDKEDEPEPIIQEIARFAATATPEDQELIRDMARRMARKSA